MPWCPVCRLEYREGFKVCNDCEAELVDELEPEKEKAEEAETIHAQEAYLTTVSNDMEAHRVEEMLEQNGVPVRMKARDPGSLIMGKTYLGIDIYVLSKDLDYAKEVIESQPTEPISEEELTAQAEQFEPEPDIIDEMDEDEDEEEYDQDANGDAEDEPQEEIQQSFVRDDQEGVKSTYIDFRWIIAFIFLGIAAVYIIVHLNKAGF